MKYVVRTDTFFQMMCECVKSNDERFGFNAALPSSCLA